MTFESEAAAIEQRLADLASAADDELVGRYALERPPMPPGLYWRMRWLAGWTLRWLEGVGLWRPDPWPVRLKLAAGAPKAKPLLIWAVGADRASLRTACESLSHLAESFPGFAPVLVTDVADFAFFSRLGWLVEFVPRLAGDGHSYDERKLRFLARLYQGAPVLPVSAGLGKDPVEEIRRRLGARR